MKALRDVEFRIVLMVAALVGTVGLATRVFAWGTTGHFYSSSATLHLKGDGKAPPAHDARILTAYCSYLPDLSSELDAITVRVDAGLQAAGTANLTWGWFNRCWGSRVRRMVSVQYYLHGLTGTDSESVTETAKAIARTLYEDRQGDSEDRVLACARGFALHLLGDSYAHRRIDNPARMYDTGLGHFRDGTEPDMPLSSERRLTIWQAYVTDMASLVAAGIAPPSIEGLVGIGRRLLPHASMANWDDAEMRTELRRTLGADEALWFPYEPAVENLESRGKTYRINKSCDEMLAAVVSPVERKQGFTCAAVWRAYASVAKRAFESSPPPCDGVDEVFE